MLYEYVDPDTGHHAGFISDELFNLTMAHRERLEAEIKHERDYQFDYFGFKTLEKSYLLKLGKKVRTVLLLTGPLRTDVQA
jgi:ribonucleotide reductase alpha subunit